MNGLRIPPHSLPAEQAILGGIFVSANEAIDKCRSAGISEASFYDRRHQVLFETISLMDAKGMIIDPITVSQHLIDNDDLDKVGGYSYLAELQDAAISTSHIGHYCNITTEKATARTAIQACYEAIDSLYDCEDAAETIANHTATIEKSTPSRQRTTADVFGEALQIDEMVASGGRIGLPFPWPDFQKRTFGLPRRAVTPLGGRDGKGKSRLATCLAVHWVCDLGIPILYFPFEDTAERFATNFSSSFAGYDAFALKRNPSPAFMNNHRNVMRKMPSFPIYIEDTPTTVSRLSGLIGEHKRRFGIEGVVIDGFKDIELVGQENQTSKEGEAMARLVATAKKHDVAIMVVMHLRDLEDGKWISKREIRGSKVLSQSSRMTLLYQDSGLLSDLVDKRGALEGRDIVLDCQKASYGEKAVQVLTPMLDQGTFKTTMETER